MNPNLQSFEGKKVSPQNITNQGVDLNHEFGDTELMSPSGKTTQ